MVATRNDFLFKLLIFCFRLLERTTCDDAILVAINHESLALVFADEVEYRKSVDGFVIDSTELHAHHVHRLSTIGIELLEHTWSGFWNEKSWIDKYECLEHLGIGSCGECSNESTLTASEQCYAGTINKIPRLHLACDVLHVCLFSENRHFGGLAFASTTVSTAAELEYIACHATHGKAFSIGFGFLFTAIETMRHDDGWLACFSGVRDEGFSPNVLSVATLAMNLARGERVVEVREVLGFHGVVGECTEVVAQEHVDVLTLVLKLPTKPHAEHLRERTAILLVEGAAMTYAQLIGKCHRHVLDVLVIDNGVGISHIALSTNEIEDRTMQFLQVFLAGTRHGYVSHARVAHDVGLHAWVSSIGKHLRASATLSTECHILEVDALVIDTLLVLVHLLSPVDSTNHVFVR